MVRKVKPVKKKRVRTELKKNIDWIQQIFELNPVEVRIIDHTAVLSGVFSDYIALHNCVAQYDGKVSGIYFTLNQLKSDWEEKVTNSFQKATQAVKDKDIACRKTLLIDVDPVREAQISATMEERSNAEKLARQIETALAEQGWPTPIVACSGNGYHLLYRVDLPNDQMSKELVKRLLLALDAEFSNHEAVVDTTTYNAGQLTKLYGTMACKGENFEERPYKRSKIISYPDELEMVSQDKLESLAAKAPKNGKAKKSKVQKSLDEEDETQAQTVIRLAENRAEFFSDELDQPYAYFQTDKSKGVWPLNSTSFNDFLTYLYWREERKTIGSDVRNQVLSVLKMTAAYNTKRSLNLRVAKEDEAIYYDLGDDDWTAIKVTPSGWKVDEKPPILFKRTKNTKQQVLPQIGGELRTIFEYVNLIREADQVLYMVYLVTSLVPEIPHPILVLSGQQGSAKSTCLRLTRALVDPAVKDLLILPSSVQELGLTLSRNYMPTFDNLDKLDQKQSDVLCMASTGGGLSKRKLYTDDEEVFLQIKHCVGLNGINVVATRPDLLDRSLVLELKRVDSTQRKEEREIWGNFSKDQPYIVGAMFDALSYAMEIYPTLKLEALTRMADFSRWGYAVAETLGIGGQTFLDAYTQNIAQATEVAISTSPVATAMVEFMNDKAEWKGLISELLDKLDNVADKQNIDRRLHIWPKAPHILSRKLNECKSNLLQVGISFEKWHDSGGTLIRITNSKPAKVKVPKRRLSEPRFDLFPEEDDDELKVS